MSICGVSVSGICIDSIDGIGMGVEAVWTEGWVLVPAFPLPVGV